MGEEKDLIPNEIKKYVSNTDKDIYTVSNLPEEVIAVIFAYVSISPKGFRENIGVVIKEEELGQERATKFHEKWVLHYGHASVAEHATVHIGIENVSRLFSSLLELSNEYLSFTEYSQRYQKPRRGDFYVPEELAEKPSLLNEYVELNKYLYDTYVQINDKLYEFLKNEIPTPEGTDEKTHFRALEKIAFEDARYALSLATYTNLGMSGNARAIEDSLTKLLSSRYPEARKRAEEIKREVRFSVPTLVKYADENKYIKETRHELEHISHSISSSKSRGLINQTPTVRLLDWTGKDKSNPEEVAIDKMIKAILFEHSDIGYEDIVKETQKTDLESKLIILRKRIEMLENATEKCENLYEKLMNESLSELAGYVVTNAHNRRIMGSFDLWELYHLTNLRMSEGAQWDIKDIIKMLAEAIQKYHPNLVSPALRRVNSSST